MARRLGRTEGLIKVRCPNPACRKILAVKSAMGGKKARCPLCGQTMAIPHVAAPAREPAVNVVREGADERPPAAGEEAGARPSGRAAPFEEAAPPEKEAPPEGPPAVEEAPPPPGPPAEEKVEGKPEQAPEAKPEEKPEEKSEEKPGEKPEEKAQAAPPGQGLPARDEVFFTAPAPSPTEPPAEEKAQVPVPPADKPPPPAPTRPGAESIMVGAPPERGHPTPRTLERVAREAAETGYELLGGTLRVVGAIGYDLNTGFRDKCDQLLASDEKDLMLDLEQVLYLSSSHIGVIARLATEAKSRDRNVKVRVTGKVARVLKFAGIDRLAEIENIDA